MSSVNTRVQWQPSPGTGILELRKEKSRDAARSRRGKENYEFYELAKMLPLPGAITSQLDKASIIRLTISYLKLRDFSSHGDPPWNRDGPPPNKSVKGDLCYYERTDSPQRHMGGPPRRRTTTAVAMEIFEAHQGTHILQSLDGFAFALASDGRFLYISETVSIYLGLSQVEMTGSSMFDYVHVQDHSEVAEQLGLCLPHGATMPSPSSTSDEGSSSAATTPRAVTPPIPDRAALMNPNPSRGYEQSFCIRMKSTLTKRGVHVKTSGYRVVQILCHMRPQFSFSLTRKHPPPLLGLVGLAIALPPPTINELLIDNDMFVSRLSPDFKVTYVEPRIGDMMDVSAEDLTNKNLYDYCHAQDLQKLRKAHVDLLNKGQVLTDYYRLLNKHGGYIWLQTCATTICNAKNVEDQNIIAINYVLSGVEYSGCVMDTKQLKTLSSMEPDQSDQSGSEAGSDPDDRKDESDKKSPSERADPDNSGSETQGGHSHHTHSSSHDGTVVQESNPPAEQDSREDSLIINYHKNVLKDENYNENSIYSSADKQKLDAKNSRRKMDRPRKRKRESESESGNQVDDMDGEIDNSNSIDALLGRRSAEPLLENGANVSSGAAASSVHSDRTSVASPPELIPQVHTPTPQDLSVKSSHGSEVPSPPMQPVSPTPTASSANSPIHSDDKWSANTNCTNVSTSSNSEPTVSSSVRDLEEAMNKHLPSLPSDADGLRAGFHSELSANHAALNFHQKHKSTIQWIGSQHAPETLPASSLLRSLYANRESVIRTNVYNPRPQFYGDMQASLLTPPGSEGYKDQYSAPAAGNAEKQPSGTYTVMSGYAANPITVAMSNNLSETYTMTPPSSVSPQEKYSLFAEQCFADGSQYRQYTSDGASHPIPIKPQAYPLPAHANAQLSTYDRSTAQYASSAGYFGHAGGFPAYNHSPSPNPVHFRDTTKGSNHW